MAKFLVTVTIKAECQYVLEMDEDTEAQAEDRAARQWRDKLPSDFQVEKGYITGWETEAEQQTAICPDCGIEHTVKTTDRPEADCWHEDPDYCKPCGEKIELEEKANGR